MRYLVISDIHADIESLNRVLDHAGSSAWERAVFLGDVIGYGNEPEAAVRKLMEVRPYVALKGNHELAALTVPRQSGYAAGARHEHAAKLSPESLDFLASFKERHVDWAWAAVHGSPRNPMEYLVSIPVARANLSHMERRLTFVGHTHVASAFVYDESDEVRPWRAHAFRRPHTRIHLSEGASAFINPGSVSQPRDGTPRAAYAIYDEAERTVDAFRI